MTTTKEPIFTIGYGARTLDEFIAILKRHGIDFLIDIRSAPYSRYKPEFSRLPLEEALRRRGIRYIYMGDTLGGQPDDRDCYVNGKVSYERIKEKPFFQQGISRIRMAFERQQRVVLMCSEGKPENCHRSKLIGVVLDELGIPVVHIDENDKLTPQEKIIHRLTRGQLELFGESPTFTSRKRYEKKQK
ncbi:MAG: DUF488 domain-containing protein [Chloroflexi bacterium]|nr:MAG: DUF488 domain-containing protein [Chloroflexota bacterium]